MGTLVKKYGFLFSLAILVVIIALPTPEGLPLAGQRMLGLLVFSVLVWMSGSISFSESALVILTLMVFLLGLSPNVDKPAVMLGTSGALVQGLAGFSNTAWALVGAALCIAIAMTKTGLDRRIALNVLSIVGAKTNRILIGIFITGFILSLFVPSSTARVACVVPIVMGIVNAFGMPKTSHFASLLIIAITQADGVWNISVKTAAAQNLIATNFVKEMLQYDISWGEWFIAAAPFGIVMAIALYFILLKVMPPEIKEIENGEAIIKTKLAEIGKITTQEIKLMVISIALLIFWVLEKKTWADLPLLGLTSKATIHPFDTSSITVIAITLMILPGIRVITWEDIEKKLNWGTLFLFGVGISLGTAIIKTQAGVWLAKSIVPMFGLTYATPVVVLGILSLFLIIVHLGFASATALASAMIPIMISILKELKAPGISMVGMTMILQYVVCFGFILPVNAPQNMIAYGTGTFTVKDFMKVGIPFTIAGFVLLMVFAVTYWSWLGLV